MDVILDETSCLVLSYAGFLRGLAQMNQNKRTNARATHPVVCDFAALFGCQAGLLGVCRLNMLAGGSDAHGGSHLNR